jgi:hypothetical protein
MPRGQLTRDIIRAEVLKLKHELDCENFEWNGNSKEIAHKYLNKVLNKIEEYYR